MFLLGRVELLIYSLLSGICVGVATGKISWGLAVYFALIAIGTPLIFIVDRLSKKQ